MARIFKKVGSKSEHVDDLDDSVKRTDAAIKQFIAREHGTGTYEIRTFVLDEKAANGRRPVKKIVTVDKFYMQGIRGDKEERNPTSVVAVGAQPDMSEIFRQISESGEIKVKLAQLEQTIQNLASEIAMLNSEIADVKEIIESLSTKEEEESDSLSDISSKLSSMGIDLKDFMSK